jgi:small subunit ribosomal protein S4
VRERQFRNYMEKALRRRGVTGQALLQLLEMRLDNVVYRLGLASSRAQARQFVSHGHILVNGRRVNISSYIVRPGEVVEVVESGRKIPPLLASIESAGGRALPAWLQFDANQMRGTVLSAPVRDEIDTDVQESLIVEFYSR